jgi:hypothetical protein
VTASRPRVVLVWALALGVLLALALPRSRIIGDGREYLLYAQAFASHLSPEIRPADLARVAGMLERSDPGLGELALRFGNEQQVGALRFGGGFVTAPDGRLYSWHFWLYPMLVAPFLLLAQAIGQAPALAFTLCNGVFVAGALAYLLLRWQAAPAARALLAGLFLTTGTTYYLWWSHPEVYTASLLLLALMMGSDRRYGPAMLASALAATQNPPLLLLLGGLAVLGLWEARRARAPTRRAAAGVAGRPDGRHAPRLAPLLAFLAASLAIAALPALFFGATLGVLNPIAAGGAADPGLIGVQRLMSMYFDLNLGLVVAAPGVLIGIALTAALLAVPWLRGLRVAAGAAPRPGPHRGFVAAAVARPGPVLLACIAISVAMALPALSTTNWNHGHTVFSRYAYWLGVPLTFGLVVCLQALATSMRTAVSLFVVGVQTLVVAYYGLFGNTWRGDYLAFKPVPSHLMRHFPALYNPVPEIFIERIAGRELPAGAGSAPREAYAFPPDGPPTKLLVGARLADAMIAACAPASVVRVEGGWRYLNLRPGATCPLPAGS